MKRIKEPRWWKERFEHPEFAMTQLDAISRRCGVCKAKQGEPCTGSGYAHAGRLFPVLDHIAKGKKGEYHGP